MAWIVTLSPTMRKTTRAVRGLVGPLLHRAQLADVARPAERPLELRARADVARCLDETLLAAAASHHKAGREHPEQQPRLRSPHGDPPRVRPAPGRNRSDLDRAESIRVAHEIGATRWSVSSRGPRVSPMILLVVDEAPRWRRSTRWWRGKRREGGRWASRRWRRGPRAGPSPGPPASAAAGYGFFSAGAPAGIATGITARPVISACLPFRSRMRAAYDEVRMTLSNCPR